MTPLVFCVVAAWDMKQRRGACYTGIVLLNSRTPSRRQMSFEMCGQTTLEGCCVRHVVFVAHFACLCETFCVGCHQLWHECVPEQVSIHHGCSSIVSSKVCHISYREVCYRSCCCYGHRCCDDATTIATRVGISQARHALCLDW